MPRTLNKRQLCIGMTVSRLIILSGPIYIIVGKSKYEIPHWFCRCICGQEIKVRHHMLARGTTSSCGCLQRERTSASRFKHGESAGNRTPELNTWNSIKQRCKQSYLNKYKCYIGIKVCERWRSSFANFLADMGRKPSSSHTIERKDVKGDYTPDNCIWATKQEQARNKRNNVHVTYRNETLCVAEWAEKLNLNANLLRRRLRDGWDVDKAFNFKKKGEAISA